MISERDCIAMAADCGLGDLPTDALVRLCGLVAQAEREACARIAETAEPYKAADLIRDRTAGHMPLFDDWGCPPCNQNCEQGRRCPNARVNCR